MFVPLAVRRPQIRTSRMPLFVPQAGRRPSKCIFVAAQIAMKTNQNSKYERMTAPKSESSRRDMQNRLILVSNGRNFDMFTAVQRSACRPHLQECLVP